MCIYTYSKYTHTYVCVYIYIYIYRERDITPYRGAGGGRPLEALAGRPRQSRVRLGGEVFYSLYYIRSTITIMSYINSVLTKGPILWVYISNTTSSSNIYVVQVSCYILIYYNV